MQRELRLLALAGVVTSKFFLIVGHSKIGCRAEEKKKKKRQTEREREREGEREKHGEGRGTYL